MKENITATIIIPINIFLAHGGDTLLREQIDSVAEDLASVNGYTSIVYIDHRLEEGYLDTSDSEHLSYLVTFEVE